MSKVLLLNHLAIVASIACAGSLLQAAPASETPISLSYSKMVQNTSTLELPAQAASMVAEARKADQSRAAVAIVRAVAAKKPAALILAVASIAKGVPEAAPAAAAAAVSAKPDLAEKILYAAVKAAPAQAQKIGVAALQAISAKQTGTILLILSGVGQASPQAMPELASAAAKFAPDLAEQIAYAAIRAAPAMADKTIESVSAVTSDVVAAKVRDTAHSSRLMSAGGFTSTETPGIIGGIQPFLAPFRPPSSAIPGYDPIRYNTP